MKPALRIAILVPLSIVAFIVLFILPDIDLGWVGGLLLLAACWTTWYQLWRAFQDWSAQTKPDDAGLALSPGEWQAWIGLLFTLVILIYFVSHGARMVAADGSMAPEASAIGETIGLLVIAWLLVMQVLRKYSRDRVDRDERDRLIQARAVEWARSSLVVFVVVLAALFAFASPDRLQWAVPMTLSNVLMAGVIGSCMLEYLVTGVSYLRDRLA